MKTSEIRDLLKDGKPISLRQLARLEQRMRRVRGELLELVELVAGCYTKCHGEAHNTDADYCELCFPRHGRLLNPDKVLWEEHRRRGTRRAPRRCKRSKSA